MKRVTLSATAALALLAGCAASPYGSAPAIPAGSQVILHEPLAFNGGARVYLQGGEAVSRGRIDRFQVACYFRLRRRGDEPLVETVQPDTFVGLDGSRSWTERRMGDRGLMRLGLAGRDEFPRTPQRRDFHTLLEIRSDRQPQVDELHCRYNGWRSREAPGLARIRTALGEWATVLPPADAR